MPGMSHRSILSAIIGLALICPPQSVLPTVLLIHDTSQMQTTPVQNLLALRNTAAKIKNYLHIKEFDFSSSAINAYALPQNYESIVLLHSGQPETEKAVSKLNSQRKEATLRVVKPAELFATLTSPGAQSQTALPRAFSLLQHEISFEQNAQSERHCVLVSGMPLPRGNPLTYRGQNKYSLNHDLLLNSSNDSGKIWCAYEAAGKIYFEEISLFTPEFTITADKFLAREKIISTEIKIQAHANLEQEFHLNLRLLPTNEKQAIYTGTRLFNYDATGKWFYPVKPDNTKQAFTFAGKEYRLPIAISTDAQPPSAMQVQILWQNYPIATNKIRIEYAGLIAATIHYLGLPLTLAILIPLFLLLLIAGVFLVKKLKLARMRHRESKNQLKPNFAQLSFLLENFQTKTIREKENPFNVSLPGLREIVTISLINDQLQLQISERKPITITEDNYATELSALYTLVLTSEYYTDNTKPVKCVKVSIRRTGYSAA